MKVVLTNLGDISTPIKISQKSLAEGHGSDENTSGKGVPTAVIARSHGTNTTPTTGSNLKHTSFLEIPKKRRILEESYSSALNSDHVASVTSSYSLLACRVCGATNSNHVNIFGPDGLKEGLPELISKCLPLQVCLSALLD